MSQSATKPEFVRPFQSQYDGILGEKLRMECLLIGNPRPKVLYANDQIANF